MSEPEYSMANVCLRDLMDTESCRGAGRLLGAHPFALLRNSKSGAVGSRAYRCKLLSYLCPDPDCASASAFVSAGACMCASHPTRNPEP
eukprot:319274-Rhodomonas_salina.1